jgi:hypothetical protein
MINGDIMAIGEMVFTRLIVDLRFFTFSGLPDSGAGAVSVTRSRTGVSKLDIVSHPFGLFTVME